VEGLSLEKDPSKVDRFRSLCLTRQLLKNMVAAGVADEILVQVKSTHWCSRSDGGIYVNTYGHSKSRSSDGEIAKKVENSICDLLCESSND